MRPRGHLIGPRDGLYCTSSVHCGRLSSQLHAGGLQILHMFNNKTTSVKIAAERWILHSEAGHHGNFLVDVLMGSMATTETKWKPEHL